MDAIAQRARDAALTLEVKKDGLQQRQTGEWVLRLTVHPNDMPMPVMTAAMGTRYQCVLVEVDENEQPKGGDATEQTQRLDKAPDPAPPPDRARTWNRLSPAQQAGILCSDPAFQKFMGEVGPERIYGVLPCSTLNENETAEYVRLWCSVDSRKSLNGNSASSRDWAELVARYRAWQREPELVG